MSLSSSHKKMKRMYGKERERRKVGETMVGGKVKDEEISSGR